MTAHIFVRVLVCTVAFISAGGVRACAQNSRVEVIASQQAEKVHCLRPQEAGGFERRP